METPNTLRFGSFELDVRSRELRSGTVCVRLQEQPLEILRLMLQRPGDVVTRDELRQRLWPEGTFVDFEHSLNAAIKRLRAALGDDADKPTFIETVPRRGYRFIGSVPSQSANSAAPASAASPRLRLVVLPFSNLSDDSSQEYFSDGLTEELIAQLGPLCRGQVGIIARWSSMFFKGSLQRAREIGEALNAEYLLEGSTRRDGSRVRITARLVEAATEAHLWSETYERSTDGLALGAGGRRRPRRAVTHARAGAASASHRRPARSSGCVSGVLEREISLGTARRHRAGRGAALLLRRRQRGAHVCRRAWCTRARSRRQRRVPTTSCRGWRWLRPASRRRARSPSIPTLSEAHAVIGDVQADARRGLGGGRSQLHRSAGAQPEQRGRAPRVWPVAGARVAIRGGARLRRSRA